MSTPPLHEAIACRDIKLARYLLANGADIQERDDAGMTPLHVAVDHETLEFVRLLLDHGADPNAPEPTPLHIAVPRGMFDIVKVLLDAGAEANALDIDGHTPLYYLINRRVSGELEATREPMTELLRSSVDRKGGSKRAIELKRTPKP